MSGEGTNVQNMNQGRKDPDSAPLPSITGEQAKQSEDEDGGQTPAAR